MPEFMSLKAATGGGGNQNQLNDDANNDEVPVMDSKLTAAEFQCVSEPCQDRAQEAATRCKGAAG